MTTFREALKVCISKSFAFSGRASRSEFWWFTLAAAVVYAGLASLQVLGGAPGPARYAFSLLLVAVAIPWLAAGFRRLHDAGFPGWPVLIPLLMSVLGKVMYYVMWFVAGDVPPQNSNALIVANVLGFFLIIFNWLTLPAWAILAFLLSRPGRAGSHQDNDLQIML